MHLLPLFCALQDTFWVARKRTSRIFGLMGVVPDSGVKYSGVDVTSWLVVFGRLRSRFRSSGGSQQRVRLTPVRRWSSLLVPGRSPRSCHGSITEGEGARRTSVHSRGSSDFDSQSSAAVATRRGRSSGWGFKRSRRRFPLAFVGEARHLVAVLDFRITLEARNPARGCLRHYRVEAGTDLFGNWLVEISYGRIGTVGRSRSFVVRDEAQARRLAQSILKRRATAPRRIGVAYRILELIDPGGWVGSSGSVGTAEVTED